MGTTGLNESYYHGTDTVTHITHLRGEEGGSIQTETCLTAEHFGAAHGTCAAQDTFEKLLMV